MDFKSLISKLDSMEAPPETPRAPELPKKIQLDEDAELRVLAGTSTILAEAEIMEKKLSKAEKEKKEEVVKSMKKDKAGFKERYGKRGEEVMHATATKKAKKTNESLDEAGFDLDDFVSKYDDEDDDVSKEPLGKARPPSDDDLGSPEVSPEPAKDDDGDNLKNKIEYIVISKVRGPEDVDKVIMPMVYKKNRDMDDQDFEDIAEKLISMSKRENINDFSDKFLKAVTNAILNPMKLLRQREDFDTENFRMKFESMVQEAKKQETKEKKVKGKKAEEKMDEGSKPDFLDIDKDGDKKEPMKKAAKEADKDGDKEESKGLSAKQKKLPPGLQKAIAAKKGKKKTVKESYEPKMSFRDMMRLVVESGGQQQIDPLDKALFSWATRVARNKLGEGMKSEVYAGMVYERMGGRFEMYDVLSEDQK
jgi:hypothetical protein